MRKASNCSLFFYQGDKLITVKQVDKHRAIFRNAEQPLAEQQTNGDRSIALLATNDKGSVLSVESEGDKEDHPYSAYGHDPSLPSLRTTTGFNGEVFDIGSNCYLLGLGYRAYSPRLGRFVAADNWSPFGQGGLNAYCYCEGDPVNSSDQSGHMRVYLANGQIMRTSKNAAISAGSWLKPLDFNRTAHRKALIDTKLQMPRRVKADNSVTEGRTHIRVFELFQNPGSSTEVAHVRAMDMQTFKRNRAEIGVLTRLHDEGDRAPALNYLARAAALMNKNEKLSQIGEALWRKGITPNWPTTTLPADARREIRKSNS